MGASDLTRAVEAQSESLLGRASRHTESGWNRRSKVDGGSAHPGSAEESSKVPSRVAARTTIGSSLVPWVIAFATRFESNWPMRARFQLTVLVTLNCVSIRRRSGSC